MIQPRLLTAGDRVAVVAPAGKIEQSGIDRALQLLDSWGLQTILGKNVFREDGYFAGTDDERLTDLQNALDDPTIAAILIARGGYGTTRILDKISLAAIRKHPKWLVGFSDLTALHLKMLSHGLCAIHGDVATTLGRDQQTGEALRKLLFEGESIITVSQPADPVIVEGRMVGGNLSLLVDSLGTASELATNERFLFIEETGEKTYRVDRMMHQLYRAGKLNNLAGLLVGQFSEIADGAASFGASWQQCIAQVCHEFAYPVIFGWPIGHEPENYPIVQGGNYRLVVDRQKASLQYLRG